jgi:hypothetical protein
METVKKAWKELWIGQQIFKNVLLDESGRIPMPRCQRYDTGRQQPFEACRDMLLERTRRYVTEVDTLRTVYGPEITGSQAIEDFTKMLLKYKEVDVRCGPPMELADLDTPLLHVDTTTYNDHVCAILAAAMVSPSPSSDEDESPEDDILPGDWRFPFFYHGNMFAYNNVVRDELRKEKERQENPPPSHGHSQFGGEGPVVSDSPVGVSPCQSNPACQSCPACQSRQSNTLHLPYCPNPSYALITLARKDSGGSSCEDGTPAMNRQSKTGEANDRGHSPKASTAESQDIAPVTVGGKDREISTIQRGRSAKAWPTDNGRYDRPSNTGGGGPTQMWALESDDSGPPPSPPASAPASPVTSTDPSRSASPSVGTDQPPPRRSERTKQGQRTCAPLAATNRATQYGPVPGMTSTPTIEEFEAAMHPNVSVNHQPGLGMGLRAGHGGVKKGELIGIQLGRSVYRHSSQPRLIEEGHTDGRYAFSCGKYVIDALGPRGLAAINEATLPNRPNAKLEVVAITNDQFQSDAPDKLLVSAFASEDVGEGEFFYLYYGDEYGRDHYPDKGASIAKDSQEPLLTETEKLDAVLHLLQGHEETTMKYASINAWGQNEERLCQNPPFFIPADTQTEGTPACDAEREELDLTNEDPRRRGAQTKSGGDSTTQGPKDEEDEPNDGGSTKTTPSETPRTTPCVQTNDRKKKGAVNRAEQHTRQEEAGEPLYGERANQAAHAALTTCTTALVSTLNSLMTNKPGDDALPPCSPPPSPPHAETPSHAGPRGGRHSEMSHSSLDAASAETLAALRLSQPPEGLITRRPELAIPLDHWSEQPHALSLSKMGPEIAVRYLERLGRKYDEMIRGAYPQSDLAELVTREYAELYLKRGPYIAQYVQEEMQDRPATVSQSLHQQNRPVNAPEKPVTPVARGNHAERRRESRAHLQWGYEKPTNPPEMGLIAPRQYRPETTEEWHARNQRKPLPTRIDLVRAHDGSLVNAALQPIQRPDHWRQSGIAHDLEGMGVTRATAWMKRLKKEFDWQILQGKMEDLSFGAPIPASESRNQFLSYGPYIRQYVMEMEEQRKRAARNAAPVQPFVGFTGQAYAEKGGATPFTECVAPGCPCIASWNGEKHQHCCLTCRDGEVCKTLCHLVPFTRPPATFSPCTRAACACPASWNGQRGQYCGTRCREGKACATPKHLTPSSTITPEADLMRSRGFEVKSKYQGRGEERPNPHLYLVQWAKPSGTHEVGGPDMSILQLSPEGYLDWYRDEPSPLDRRPTRTPYRPSTRGPRHAWTTAAPLPWVEPPAGLREPNHAPPRSMPPSPPESPTNIPEDGSDDTEWQQILRDQGEDDRQSPLPSQEDTEDDLNSLFYNTSEDEKEEIARPPVKVYCLPCAQSCLQDRTKTDHGPALRQATLDEATRDATARHNWRHLARKYSSESSCRTVNRQERKTLGGRERDGRLYERTRLPKTVDLTPHVRKERTHANAGFRKAMMTNNLQLIMDDERGARCIYCLSRPSVNKYTEVVDNSTVVCPECGVDAVIPASAVESEERLHAWRYLLFTAKGTASPTTTDGSTKTVKPADPSDNSGTFVRECLPECAKEGCTEKAYLREDGTSKKFCSVAHYRELHIALQQPPRSGQGRKETVWPPLFPYQGRGPGNSPSRSQPHQDCGSRRPNMGPGGPTTSDGHYHPQRQHSKGGKAVAVADRRIGRPGPVPYGTQEALERLRGKLQEATLISRQLQYAPPSPPPSPPSATESTTLIRVTQSPAVAYKERQDPPAPATMWETLQKHPTITEAVKDLWHLFTGYPSTPHYASVSTKRPEIVEIPQGAPPPDPPPAPPDPPQEGESQGPEEPRVTSAIATAAGSSTTYTKEEEEQGDSQSTDSQSDEELLSSAGNQSKKPEACPYCQAESQCPRHRRAEEITRRERQELESVQRSLNEGPYSGHTRGPDRRRPERLGRTGEAICRDRSERIRVIPRCACGNYTKPTPEDPRFCSVCNALGPHPALSKVCLHCKEGNQQTFIYCTGCGQTLPPPSFAQHPSNKTVGTATDVSRAQGTPQPLQTQPQPSSGPDASPPCSPPTSRPDTPVSGLEEPLAGATSTGTEDQTDLELAANAETPDDPSTELALTQATALPTTAADLLAGLTLTRTAELQATVAPRPLEPAGSAEVETRTPPPGPTESEGVEETAMPRSRPPATMLPGDGPTTQRPEVDSSPPYRVYVDAPTPPVPPTAEDLAAYVLQVNVQIQAERNRAAKELRELKEQNEIESSRALLQLSTTLTETSEELIREAYQAASNTQARLEQEQADNESLRSAVLKNVMDAGELKRGHAEELRSNQAETERLRHNLAQATELQATEVDLASYQLRREGTEVENLPPPLLEYQRSPAVQRRDDSAPRQRDNHRLELTQDEPGDLPDTDLRQGSEQGDHYSRPRTDRGDDGRRPNYPVPAPKDTQPTTARVPGQEIPPSYDPDHRRESGGRPMNSVPPLNSYTRAITPKGWSDYREEREADAYRPAADRRVDLEDDDGMSVAESGVSDAGRQPILQLYLQDFDVTVAALSKSPRADLLKDLLISKSDNSGSVWNTRAFWVQEVIEAWERKVFQSRSERSVSYQLQKIERMTFDKGLKDLNQQTQSATWHEFRGDMILALRDGFNTGCQWEHILQRLLNAAKKRETGNPRVFRYAKEALEDKPLLDDNWSRGGGYGLLGADVFLLRLDESFKADNYGARADQNEWLKTTSREDGEDVLTLNSRVMAAYEKFSGIPVSDIHLDPHHRGIAFERLALCLENDSQNKRRGVKAEKLFKDGISRFEEEVRTGYKRKEELSSERILRFYVMPEERNAKAQPSKPSEPMYEQRRGNRSERPRPVAVMSVQPEPREWQTETQPLVGAVPFTPNTGHRMEPPPTSYSAAPTAHSPTAHSAAYVASFDKLTDRERMWGRECDPPAGNKGHPLGRAWTSEDWKNTRIDYEKLVQMANDPQTQGALNRFMPLTTQMNSCRKEIPKKINDRWGPKACLFCTNRPTGGLLGGNLVGNHPPATCRTAKRWLCEGGDPQNAKVAKELQKCVIFRAPRPPQTGGRQPFR